MRQPARLAWVANPPSVRRSAQDRPRTAAFSTPQCHSSAEIADLSGNPWTVSKPTLENYWALLSHSSYPTHFLNSVIVTVCVVAITMAVYLTISLVTSFFMNIYNRRVAIVER